jgi:hypothetical protein
MNTGVPGIPDIEVWPGVVGRLKLCQHHVDKIPYG